MNTALVILGSPNDHQGKLSDIALSRCHKALDLWAQYPACKILCTGGFGEHLNQAELAHGEYLKRYLISRGIESQAFLDIALSRFTLEDASLSKPILEANQITRVVLVTSNFHRPRAQLIFQSLLSDIDFIWAESNVLNMKAEDYDRLATHEAKAIERDRKNLINKTE